MDPNIEYKTGKECFVKTTVIPGDCVPKAVPVSPPGTSELHAVSD